MLLNGGPDDLPLQGLHLSVSAFLVLTHQRGETDHIGSEDRGETALSAGLGRFHQWRC
jgi:hypothetical protein